MSWYDLVVGHKGSAHLIRLYLNLLKGIFVLIYLILIILHVATLYVNNLRNNCFLNPDKARFCQLSLTAI